MLKVCLLVLATAYLTKAVPVDVYPSYFEYIDGEGKLHREDLTVEPNAAVLSAVRNSANNQYLLFTRRNPNSAQQLRIHNAQSITSSNFNANVPTVVIAHGWLNNQHSDLNPVIRDAYLGVGDYNVIVVDWQDLSRSGYVTAVAGVPEVGRGLGNFLNFLVEVTGARLDQFHLVGFSLGAHLVGNAGRTLGGRVGRVTGLDPAGPLWVYNSDKIGAADAIYVEGIHTDGNFALGLGIGTEIGHADFFPNGGNNQPGCITGICDHNRAWELFAASVTHNHLLGSKCESSLQFTLNTCRGDILPMGNGEVRKSGSGTYRLDTGRRYPF